MVARCGWRENFSAAQRRICRVDHSQNLGAGRTESFACGGAPLGFTEKSAPDTRPGGTKEAGIVGEVVGVVRIATQVSKLQIHQPWNLLARTAMTTAPFQIIQHSASN